MKISEIRYDNFRGAKEKIIGLNGIDIFTGTNGIGKTRMLQAVQLAILGSVPHPRDPKNIETAKLFTDREGIDKMMVTLFLDGADRPFHSFARLFEKKISQGKESIKESIEILPEKKGNATDLNRMLKEQLGDFPVMLDFNEFTRLSDDKRMEFIFNLCPIDKKWTIEFIQNRVTSSLDIFDPEKLVKGDFLIKLSMNISGEPTEAIVSSLMFLSKRLSETNKQIRTSEAASMGSVQMTAPDAKRSMRHIDDIIGDLSEKRKLEQGLIQEIATSTAKNEGRTRLEEEKEQLKKQIEESGSYAKRTAIDDLEKKMNDYKSSLNDFTETANELTDLYVKKERSIAGIIEYQRNIDDNRKQIQRLKEKKKSFASGKCPTCDQVVNFSVDLDDEINLLQEKLDHDNVILTEHSDNANMFSIQINDINEKQRVMSQQDKELHVLINDAMNKISHLTGESSGIETLRERLKQLNELPEYLIVDVSQLNIRLEGVRISISDMEKEKKETQEYNTNVLAAKTAALNAKKEKMILEMIKKSIDELKAIRTEMIIEALDPIKYQISDISKCLHFNAEFDFRLQDNRGNEAFRFGWKTKGVLNDSFIEFDSLSTAQQLFTIISLLTPLITRGNNKLKILTIDNAEVIHRENQEYFMDLLIECKEFIDNILVASSLEFIARPGITIHHLV